MNFLEPLGEESSERENRTRPVVDAFFPTIVEVHAQEATGESRKNERTISARNLLLHKKLINTPSFTFDIHT